MERDPNISKLIRESGLSHAPDHFSERVMREIGAEPEKKSHKPLIGFTGRLVIVLFVAAIVVVSIVFTEPRGLLQENNNALSGWEWKLPKLNLDFSKLSEIQLGPWWVSAVVAVFLLILSDAGLTRHRRMQL